MRNIHSFPSNCNIPDSGFGHKYFHREYIIKFKRTFFSLNISSSLKITNYKTEIIYSVTTRTIVPICSVYTDYNIKMEKLLFAISVVILGAKACRKETRLQRRSIPCSVTVNIIIPILTRTKFIENSIYIYIYCLFSNSKYNK